MLRAAAFIVADRSALEKPLRDVMREVGLQRVERFARMDVVVQQLSRTPLCFFLFAEVPNPIILSPVLNQIRTHARRQIRFAPLVYFSESPSAATIALCSTLGFDDVLTSPITPRRVRQRLMGLVGRHMNFIESENYVGPDRWYTHPTGLGRGPLGAVHQARILDLRRDFEHGVTVFGERALVNGAVKLPPGAA